MTTIAERRLSLLFALAIAIGVFFRLYHTDWKLFSFDETATAIRASGHTFADAAAFIHDGRSHHIADLEAFQSADPATGAGAVWTSLQLEDPQHPPLYFLITRLSEQMTGDSVANRRLPAIVFGLLGLLAAWWFARELFREGTIALCFTALVAVAPFHVVYAQQAREYSLWTLLICLSSAVLLRGVRTGRKRYLVLYAVVAAMGLWSFPLFACVIVAHAIYIAVPASQTPVRVRVLFLCAALASAASFVPWILVMIGRSHVALQDTTWTAAPLSPIVFAGKWLFNWSTMFFDLDYLSVMFLPVAVVLTALSVWCCAVFARRATAQAIAFATTLGGVTALAFLVPDIVFHQSRSVQSRYLTPLWIAVELAVAYGLVSGLRSRGKRAWAVAGSCVFASAIVSCAVSSAAHSWWLANTDKTIPGIALSLAGQVQPTIVYADDDTELLELSAIPAARHVAFIGNRTVNARALSQADDPFVIMHAPAAASAAVSGLARVAEVRLFPSGTDPLLTLLRRRAAADRHGDITGAPLLFRPEPGVLPKSLSER